MLQRADGISETRSCNGFHVSSAFISHSQENLVSALEMVTQHVALQRLQPTVYIFGFQESQPETDLLVATTSVLPTRDNGRGGG